MGGFFASMFGMYTYSFLLGAHWMRNQWTTLTLEDKPYTAGDVLCVFFGVLFGMFALGMAGPNFKAVSEGKVAGKMAFDIIDRKPAIPPNEGKQVEKLEGTISFKNVTFRYPSRPDQIILDDFSYEF
jgi:ABC-type multidrug transport system fused ATPase/permease subunit